MFRSYFLVGGAGFIGSHFVDALFQQSEPQQVTLFDNFSKGRESHYEQHAKDPRLSVIKGEAADTELLSRSMSGHEVVMHFASNADIAMAMSDPSIDFNEGFALTHYVLEAARINKIKRLVFTSGSGVYGDMGESPCFEDQGRMIPISTYGASKLAGEAFIASYCHMFDLTACVFRFANVVGPRQTHGVGFDFVRQLSKNPSFLSILGDGNQRKPYIHVHDIVQAVLHVNATQQTSYEVYNVATDDSLSVLEIANMVVKCMGLEDEVCFKFSGGDRGWRGDVPIVRMNTDKIRRLGWRSHYNSSEAMKASIVAMIEEVSHDELVGIGV